MRLGIDVGGTKTAAVVLDDQGTVLHSATQPTGFGESAVMATIIAVAEGLAQEAGITVAEFSSMGIGIPGTVQPDTGRVEHAVNLGLKAFHLGDEVRARYGIPVLVENDVNAAAVGAYRLVAEEEPGLAVGGLAYLNIGTGLAAGLVLAGQLRRGASGVAGEIGHLPVDPNGARCVCGQRGCLETVCSGSAIARRWPGPSGTSVQSLIAAADAGDPQAQGIRDDVYAGIATAVRTLVLSVDVRTIVLGGGVTSIGVPLLEGVRAVIDGWAAQSPFLASLGLAERIRVLPAGHSVAAIGAALVGERP